MDAKEEHLPSVVFRRRKSCPPVLLPRKRVLPKEHNQVGCCDLVKALFSSQKRKMVYIADKPLISASPCPECEKRRHPPECPAAIIGPLPAIVQLRTTKGDEDSGPYLIPNAEQTRQNMEDKMARDKMMEKAEQQVKKPTQLSEKQPGGSHSQQIVDVDHPSDDLLKLSHTQSSSHTAPFAGHSLLSFSHQLAYVLDINPTQSGSHSPEADKDEVMEAEKSPPPSDGEEPYRNVAEEQSAEPEEKKGEIDAGKVFYLLDLDDTEMSTREDKKEVSQNRKHKLQNSGAAEVIKKKRKVNKERAVSPVQRLHKEAEEEHGGLVSDIVVSSDNKLTQSKTGEDSEGIADVLPSVERSSTPETKTNKKRSKEKQTRSRARRKDIEQPKKAESGKPRTRHAITHTKPKKQGVPVTTTLAAAQENRGSVSATKGLPDLPEDNGKTKKSEGLKKQDYTNGSGVSGALQEGKLESAGMQKKSTTNTSKSKSISQKSRRRQEKRSSSRKSSKGRSHNHATKPSPTTTKEEYKDRSTSSRGRTHQSDDRKAAEKQVERHKSDERGHHSRSSSWSSKRSRSEKKMSSLQEEAGSRKSKTKRGHMSRKAKQRKTKDARSTGSESKTAPRPTDGQAAMKELKVKEKELKSSKEAANKDKAPVDEDLSKVRKSSAAKKVRNKVDNKGHAKKVTSKVDNKGHAKKVTSKTKQSHAKKSARKGEEIHTKTKEKRQGKHKQ